MSPATARSTRSLDDLRDHVREAYEVGLGVDLGDVVYGPATDGGGYRDETMSYYALLAGHTAMTEAATVVEIGTHYGGSTLALLAGVRAGGAADARVVTMDVTELNVERLAQEPEIVRLTGDSTELGFVRSLATQLPSPQSDLLYIDALKDAGFVLRTLHNVHLAGLAPTWLILDDIQATDSMRALWDALAEAEPDHAFLLSAEFPHIRNPRYGYAILHLAEAPGLLSRCIELMERLGLDTAGMTDDDQPFQHVRDTDPKPGYAKRHPGAPILGVPQHELSVLEGLAASHVRGHGEVVDFGSTIGTSTRALLEGLAVNPRAHDRQRVHAYDSFIRDHLSLSKIVGDRIERGGSLRPDFDRAIGNHAANVYTIEPHLGRWYGAPIELFVASAVRSARVGAHVIAEFSPHFLAGSTVMVYREALSIHRPWLALEIAFLRDHFELLRADRSLVVLGFTSPVPADKIARLVEDRFAEAERFELVRAYADDIQQPHARWGFLAHAASIATRLHLPERAAEIEAELTELGTGGDAWRDKRLATLRERIAEAREEVV